MIDRILEGIPDKKFDKNTTSLKFKEDLIEFLGDDYKNKTCLEIGTSKGYSTRILSFLFKKVITCENNSELIEVAKDVNKDRNNIEFLQKDVYRTEWNFEDIDVVFIDCDHEISAVLSDIRNSINLCKPNEELLLIFDDYGLDNPWEGVKEAIQKNEHNSEFTIVKEIGQPKGWEYRADKFLKEVEGIICKYINRNLMVFWRIMDNKLYTVKETGNLGFEESEGLRIPDEYLVSQKFMVMRTCHGIGDWGIISAMPRLLKEKYPDCKVYVPTKKLLKTLYGQDHNNIHVIFDNNPYVDEFVDSIEGEVFHDHYRVYDKSNTNIPLTKQILKFWQFTEEEMKDYQPEMYWSNEEQKLGDEIIKEYVGDKKFGCLLVSDRFGTQMGNYDEKSYNKDTEVMSKVLKNNPLPYFYWTYKPLSQTEFGFIDAILDIRNIDLRIQLYIKSKAKINVSNQCGTNHSIVRYSKSYESVRQYPLGMNFIDGINYL